MSNPKPLYSHRWSTEINNHTARQNIGTNAAQERLAGIFRKMFYGGQRTATSDERVAQTCLVGLRLFRCVSSGLSAIARGQSSTRTASPDPPGSLPRTHARSTTSSPRSVSPSGAAPDSGGSSDQRGTDAVAATRHQFTRGPGPRQARRDEMKRAANLQNRSALPALAPGFKAIRCHKV